MNENDLFIIIKSLLWYNVQVIQMPSDEEIKKFIKVHKDKEEK